MLQYYVSLADDLLQSRRYTVADTLSQASADAKYLSREYNTARVHTTEGRLVKAYFNGRLLRDESKNRA